jgi:hypothetical protein
VTEGIVVMVGVIRVYTVDVHFDLVFAILKREAVNTQNYPQNAQVERSEESAIRIVDFALERFPNSVFPNLVFSIIFEDYVPSFILNTPLRP